MQKNKFTKNAINAVDYANKVCLKLKDAEMKVEHLFMGIIFIKNGVGSKVLSRLGLDPDATLASIEHELASKKIVADGEGEYKSGEIVDVTISPEIKSVFEKAFEIAIKSGHSYVGTEHLLLGIFNLKENLFVSELNKLGLNYDRLKTEIDSFVQYPDLQSLNNPDQFDFPQDPKSPFIKSQSNSFFDTYGRNLTQDARDGKLDPVIGREKEVERLMQVLSRRSKNNPILIGDAGVGKTAIVEGLAQKIASGDISPVLSNFDIWSIDTASIIAGSQLRGDVESKILDMIDDVEKRGNVILFIDEIHTILGAGATSNNSLDIGNILKPALARGALHCIGATTADEYRKHFDEDPALQRRFQPIDVEELSEEDTIHVLLQLKKVYEEFHDVKITNEAINSAVKLTNRYITDRFLPDKAIDVIDEACAKNKLLRVKFSKSFKTKLQKLKEIIEEKNTALQKNMIDEAANLLEQEKKVMRSLEKIEKKMRDEWKNGKKIITEKEIKSVIHNWTKIPMNSIDEKVIDTIEKLKNDLSQNIIGQDYASNLVINAIKRAKAGLAGFDRPLSTFLFVGPTGVGKTELAKQLAKSLFGTKEALIQVDMSELMEPHSVSKLIGSPPGYVGYDQGGQLTDKVRRRPFSVILFDEIEKASPEVLNILLQIMEDGRLTDSKGKAVNFKNTIIIMTSNIGAELLRKDSVVGIYLGEKTQKPKPEMIHAVSEAQEKIIEELKEYLQPEFLNRIDDIIVFRELDKEDIAKITKLHIENFINRVKSENNIQIKLKEEEKIIKHLTKLGFSEEYGAREIRRIIRSMLENVVAEKILETNWDSDSKKALKLELTLDSKKQLKVKEEKVKSKVKQVA
jgi:ATP-dependent Clp protease ATP-binding subunit ClpC